MPIIMRDYMNAAAAYVMAAAMVSRAPDAGTRLQAQRLRLDAWREMNDALLRAAEQLA